jgi:hypothetical protein
MDFSKLRDRLSQIKKEIDELIVRSSNRLTELIAIEKELNRRDDEQRAASLPLVDRGARILISGETEADRPDYREIELDTGMQKSYVVLTAEERAKGFVRPVRRTYKHKTCGATTTMAPAIAETYARDPKFYQVTFCATCRSHFAVDQFVWAGTDERVGS